MQFKKIKKNFPQTPRQLPLQAVLIVPFVLQIFAAVGLVGYLSFRNGQKAVNDVATQLRSEVSDRVKQYLDSYLAQTLLVNKINEDAIKRGDLDFNLDESTEKAEKLFSQQINTFSWVSLIHLSSEKGGYISFTRWAADNSVNAVISNKYNQYKLDYYEVDSRGKRTGKIVKTTTKKYDPRVRPAYKAAKQKKRPIWSPVYLEFVSRQPIIASAVPIYNDRGQLEGVLGVNFFLEAISKFISNLKIGRSGQIFIIERSGLLIASSTKNQLVTLPKKHGEEPQRIQARDSSDRTIEATAKNLIQRFGDLSNIQGKQQLEFMLSGERQFLQVMPFQDSLGLDWLVVVVVPEADFMEQINSNNQTTILLCAAALIVATAVGLLTSKSVIQPLLRLNKAAKEIATGKFDRPVNIERHDEIGELATSFNNMAQQLQESFTALEAKNADLQRLDRLKDEFLANTSHELRTPLNGMIGIAESMIDGATGEIAEIQRKNLLLIALSGHRLSNLVNDILDFSKLKHQNLELQLKPVGMREIAEVVIMLSKALVGRKNLQLINSIAPDFPPANADENRIEQILHNLVGNAIKFTAEGQVEISGELVTNDNWKPPSDGELPAMHSYLAITVSDTGIGIPENKFDRIFESFEQADGSTAREYGGTGLGLTVTKKLVELHGGAIEVESTIGAGSKFTFTLPISDREIEQKRGACTVASLPASAGELFDNNIQSPTPPRENGQEKVDKIKITIVDDEPVNLQVLANHLSLENYVITQANNGLEALELIENNFIPDLILLDVMMPKMTGYEVTRRIREQYAATEIPIVLLTAKNQVRDLLEGLDSGANDYLTKPIAKDELLARIKTHINLCRLRAENTRMNSELEIARRLQQMNLPKESELQGIEGLEIAGFMEPAAEIGGDYYDVLKCNGKVKIGIGDVTGHGLESGILMLMVQTAVRTLLTHNETDAVKYLNTINQTMYDSLERMNSSKNMTLCLLDYSDRALMLSGQHEEIIVVRNNGEVELVDTMDLGFPIGLEADITDFIASTKIELNLDDVVVLYTDGITEAFDINKVQYGLERLVEIVKQNRQLSANDIKEIAIADVKRHIGKQKVYDDITLVVLKQK